MLKQLSTAYLLHNNIHIFIRLISFPHLNNIWMRNQFNNLNLFSQKFAFSLTQWCFINLLNRNRFLSFFILTLKNSWKFPITQFPWFIILFIKTQIACTYLKCTHPIINHNTVIMIKDDWFYMLLVVRNTEGMMALRV